MPSKAKKQSKTQSRLSNSEQSATPSDLEANEEDILRCIDEASSKFPSVIGKSAFVDRVTDVDPQTKGCKIWLSEPSMVASSLAPGTIVSVSLASSGKKFSTL